MRYLIHIAAAALTITVAAPTAFAAQSTQRSRETIRAHAPSATAMARVIEIQANPRGLGRATTIPPNPATAASPVPPTIPDAPNHRGGPYVGAMTTPPLQAMNKTYLLCSKTVQDSCINRNQVSAHTKT